MVLGVGVLAAAAGCSSREVRTSVTSPPEPPPSATAPSSALPLTRAEAVERFGRQPSGPFGTAVPGVVSHLTPGTKGVALTFDACGGPGGGDGYDHALIAALRHHQVRATLFLNTRWIAANEAIAAELVADPLFELANHGHRHLPLSVAGRSAYGIRGTRSIGEAYDEIAAASQWFIDHTGGLPRWFRPGTAHTDRACARMARALGQPIAGFAVNADAGASLPADSVTTAMLTAQAGDIVIGHLNRPAGGTAEGVSAALPQMLERGTRFVTLG